MTADPSRREETAGLPETCAGGARPGTGDDGTDLRITSFMETLDQLKAIMTTGQHLTSLEIRIVENALRRLQVTMRGGTPVPPAARRSVGRALDQLRPPLDDALRAYGTAERGRLFERLRMRASEQRAMVAVVGRVVDPDDGAARFRGSLTAAAEQDLLIEVRSLLDRSVDRVEHLVREHRRGDEVREKRFAEFVRAKSEDIDRLTADAGTAIARAVSRLDELNQQAGILVSQVGLISGEESLARLNKDRLAEERKEERQFRWFRAAGICWALLGLSILLFLLVLSPPGSMLVWLGHIAPALLLASLSTYCVRIAARHRVEAVALRDDRLDMDAAVLSVAGGFSDAQLSNLKECLDRLAEDRISRRGSKSGESDSISLPLPQGWRSVSARAPRSRAGDDR